MICKGSQRAGAKQLASHLLNDRDNDHVTVLELRGFVASDLNGAFQEAHAVSRATKCTQYLFSLSLNPPKDAVLGEAAFLEAADRAEKALGLSGQPRAVVIHEKEGRRHAHVVWSRIDGEALKAINLPHFKTKLTHLSRELYLDHGWILPEGLRGFGSANVLNFTLAEWQQARRLGIDPREIKGAFRDAWERSDSLKGFANALAERGYQLASGDRRALVAVNVQGEVFSVARMAGVKAKELSARFGKPEGLPAVGDVQATMRGKRMEKVRAFIAEARAGQAREAKPLRDERDALVARHRAERERLKAGQEARWQAEEQARSGRLRRGVSGLFDRLTGRTHRVTLGNEREAWAAVNRDRAQRDALVIAQMEERQALQKRIDALRARRMQDRRLLARDLGRFLRSGERGHETDAHDKAREPARAPAPVRTRNPRPGPDLDI